MEIPFLSQEWTGCTETVAGNEVATLSCIPIVMTNIIMALLAFSGFVAVIFIIWGGIKYSSSRGDPQAVESAKKTITWAIIGLVFILLSLALLSIIKSVTGVQFEV